MLRRRRSLGLTTIEMIAATAIVGVSIGGMMSLFSFSFNVTKSSDERSVGYHVARRNIERVRALGFKFASEGSQTRYYGAAGDGEVSAQAQSSVFRVVTTITSDKLAYNAFTNTYRAADDAIRTVVVTVTLVSGNAEVAKIGTYLVRSGV